MKTYKIKPEFWSNWGSEIDEDSAIVDEEEIKRLASEWGVSVDDLMDQVEEEETVLKISKIAIKSETFCTACDGNLYCIDVCEDAEERSAWLYRSDNGVKMLMWGEEVENDRDKFLNCVFSNLPDYIENYEEEYGD